jgi:hypothetical protein
MPRGVYKREGAPTKGKAAPTSRDALVYLTHAERAIIAKIKGGRMKKMVKQDLMVLMALSALRGE